MNTCKTNYIPSGIRLLVFSYLPLMEIIDSISKLDKESRKFVQCNKSLDQKMKLRINIKTGTKIKYDPQFLYIMDLASEYEICMYRF